MNENSYTSRLCHKCDMRNMKTKNLSELEKVLDSLFDISVPNTMTTKIKGSFVDPVCVLCTVKLFGDFKNKREVS